MAKKKTGSRKKTTARKTTPKKKAAPRKKAAARKPAKKKAPAKKAAPRKKVTTRKPRKRATKDTTITQLRSRIREKNKIIREQRQMIGFLQDIAKGKPAKLPPELEKQIKKKSKADTPEERILEELIGLNLVLNNNAAKLEEMAAGEVKTPKRKKG